MLKAHGTILIQCKIILSKCNICVCVTSISIHVISSFFLCIPFILLFNFIKSISRTDALVHIQAQMQSLRLQSVKLVLTHF